MGSQLYCMPFVKSRMWISLWRKLKHCANSSPNGPKGVTTECHYFEHSSSRCLQNVRSWRHECLFIVPTCIVYARPYENFLRKISRLKSRVAKQHQYKLFFRPCKSSQWCIQTLLVEYKRLNDSWISVVMDWNGPRIALLLKFAVSVKPHDCLGDFVNEYSVIYGTSMETGSMLTCITSRKNKRVFSFSVSRVSMAPTWCSSS